MSDSERLKAVIDYLAMNPREFALSLGFARADSIYHILNGKNRISRNMALRITTKYPFINELWLLSNKGDMKTDGTTPEIRPNLCPECHSKDRLIEAKEKIIEVQDRNIELLRREIESLRNMDYDKKVTKLKKDVQEK